MREIFRAVPNKIETEPPPAGEVFGPGVPGGGGGPGAPGTVLSWLGFFELGSAANVEASHSSATHSAHDGRQPDLQGAPSYPALAKATGAQGPVVLGAVISRTGTIASCTQSWEIRLLVKAAIEAVEQWRYPPYRLNGDPVEVETEVTVNFVLAGG